MSGYRELAELRAQHCADAYAEEQRIARLDEDSDRIPRDDVHFYARHWRRLSSFIKHDGPGATNAEAA